MRYRFADCELDSDRLELRRAGQPVPVEPQVFDLLRYLVENAGVAVSKDQIFETIWRGRIVSDSALISRIKSVRKAIGDNGQDQEMIKTLHRRGFRFMPPVTVLGTATAAANAEAGESAEPDLQPSLIVRPLKNLSRLPDSEQLAEGITNELVRLLSRSRWLKVVASAFCPLHEPSPGAPSPGGAYRFHYVLDGSIDRTDTRLRLNIRLIDAGDGTQIWCERYDRDVTDLFDVQDELAQVIAGTLEPELARIEAVAADAKEAETLGAWRLCLQGYEHLFRFTREGSAEAARLFSRAIVLDPQLGRAHAGHSCVNLQEAFYGDPASRAVSLEKALAFAHHAVATDERDAFGYYARARAHTMKHQLNEAETALRTALSINPSFAQAHFALGFIRATHGRPDEALGFFERFTVLSPWDPFGWSGDNLRALSYFRLGDLAKAELYARRSVSQPRATRWPFATLVAVLGAEGRPEADQGLHHLLERKPDYSIAVARDDFFFINDPDLEARYVAGLRAAGVPEL